MSVTIGYRLKDKVLVLTDTRRGMGSQIFRGLSPSVANVFTAENGIVVAHGGNRDGYSAAFSLRDLIGELELPLTHKTLVTEFIPAYYAALKSTGAITDEMVRNGSPSLSGNLLFAAGNDLFVVDSDFSVIRIERYALIGSGWEYTDFGMSETAPDDDENTVKEKMLAAMRDACRFHRNVAPPFLLFETGKDGYETIREV